MTESNVMEVALKATATPDKAAELAATAARLGIQPDDPAWGLVLLAVDVAQAAVTAGAAASRIETATASVSDAVLHAATAAGRDTAGVIKKEVVEGGAALVSALGIATKKAAAGLARAAAAQGPAIIDGWKRDLADAAREEARLGQWNSLTLSWALAVVLLSAGAMLMYLYLRG